MTEAESKNNPKYLERMLCVLFLLILFVTPVADRFLIHIESGRSALQTEQADFPTHPYKPNADKIETAYGDLARMLGNRRLMHEYGRLVRNHIRTDSLGFAAPSGVTPENADMVIAGDSFATAGTSADDMIAGMITSEAGSGFRAYNIGFPGNVANSGLAFMRLFKPVHTAVNRKRMLVFVICKRNLTGEAVQDIRIVSRYSARQFKLRLLKRKVYRLLPHFFLRQANQQSVITKYVRETTYALINVFEILPRKAPGKEARDPISPVDSVVIGKKGTLFFRPEVDFWKKTIDAASVESFAETMLFVRDEATLRGFDFMVVLVPDKSDLYPELLPDGLRPPADDPIASYFSKVESAVSARRVRVLNLLPAMRTSASRCKCMLYLRDDTHWNARGKRLVVRSILMDIEQSKREELLQSIY